MKTCPKCGDQYKSRIIVNGKEMFVGGRKYCIKCSPIKNNMLKETRVSRNTIENGIKYRICSKCNSKKELNVDNYGKPKKNGNHYTICKNCVLKSRKYIRKEIKVMAVEYKGGKCLICGYNKYYGSLDFHHLDPKEKDFSLSKATPSQLNDVNLIKQELDKCILVCSNCHGEIHAGLIELDKVTKFKSL